MIKHPYSNWYNAGLIEPQGYFFEMIVKNTYQHILRPGDTAIDGGACNGWHTIPMAECVGPGGKIIAVEAIPEQANQLKTTAPKQVSIVTKALGDHQGKTNFNWVKGMPELSGIHLRPLSKDLKRTVEPIVVALTTIDKLVSHLKPSRCVRFIKLDLEGGEYHALKGASTTMERDRPFIIFESGRGWLADIYGYTKEDWFRLFLNAGYRLFDLFGRPFNELNWDSRKNDKMPWYFIAVGNKTDEYYLESEHASIIQAAHKSFQLKSWAYKIYAKR